MQEVDILVNGKPVRQIAHEGKLYIIAKRGSEYSIRLKNNSTSRVTGVCSVDGLNVVDGEPAKEQGAGYIINGYGSYTIRGYRTSDNEVHPFIFNRKSESYASKSESGDPRNCGVIGVVFWSEKQKPAPVVIEKHIYHDQYIPWYRRYPWYTTWDGSISGADCNKAYGDTYRSFNNCSSLMSNTANLSSPVMVMNSASFDLGTKFSDQTVHDAVQSVEFEFGRRMKTIEIYYASKSALRDMGVPVDQASSVTFPKAFQPGYCKPPRS
jgi:hypothetical protein